MGLFPQFPYSNLHELNLDWIIEQIRQVTGEGVVLSVNGLSGVVTLYTENDITLPDCHFDTEWSVARLIDEKIAGIKFTGEKFFYITKNHDAEEFTVQEVYTSGNPPPYPVTSVNGHDGAVVLAGDNLPYVIDGPYTIEDIVNAIQSAIGSVITGKKCNQAVSAGQYVFLIMSNITGRADGLYKAVNDVQANIDFTTGDLSPTTVGLGGKLGEAEDDIDDLDTRLTSVETDTATLKDDLPAVAESVAFIINGNTCPQAVTAGQYAILIHSTVAGRADGFYKAVNNVSANTAWTSADLQAVSGGLGAEVAILDKKVSSIVDGNTIVANSDLNNYMTPGNYYATTAVAQTLSNCPVQNAFLLEVIQARSGNIIQRITRVSQPQIQYTRQNTDVWTDTGTRGIKVVIEQKTCTFNTSGGGTISGLQGTPIMLQRIYSGEDLGTVAHEFVLQPSTNSCNIYMRPAPSTAVTITFDILEQI